MNIKKHKFIITTLLIVFLVIIILSAYLLCAYIIIDIFNRNKGGEEYAKKWACDEFKITFTSYEERFPFIPSCYNGQIEINNETQNIVIKTDSDFISIGTEGELYYDSMEMPCRDFYPIASGTAYYNGFNYIVRINSVEDKEFEYLMSQVLIFSRIE